MNLSTLNKSQFTDISISQILVAAGFRPVETCGGILIYEAWSPLAGTNIKIACDDMLGVWYDQHAKKGGQALELVKHRWHVSDAAAIHKIELLIKDHKKGKRPRIKTPVKIPYYVLEDVRDLGTNVKITQFLCESGLFESAKHCFKEIYYYTVDFKGLKKQFYAAACPNTRFGWQVLSKHFNGCIGRESYTLIKKDPGQIVVFENQFAYLNWQRENCSSQYSAIILNSPDWICDAIKAARLYPKIELFLTTSPTGITTATYFKNALPQSGIHRLDVL